ncbi:MAG: NAD-dependent epimerase/dehydratase family protein [bacterium]
MKTIDTMRHVLITGGCGFIGSNLAVRFAHEGHRVTCLDNLARRGSELILHRLREAGCAFVHGDIRSPEDLDRLGDGHDLLVECSAEPSVLVGASGNDAAFAINNNLVGSIHCMEFARKRGTPVLFLSTSRVYPYERLNGLAYRSMPTRTECATEGLGISPTGVSETFPIEGARSLYGATKLCSELLLQEYGAQYGVPAIINRCGVVAGPWQMGKVDQGVFTFWLSSHHWGRPLRYIGFSGKGEQVRDLLHIDDLADLVVRQAARIGEFRGEVFNVGGSRTANLSLAETTELCRAITGRTVPIAVSLETRPADVVWYISNIGKVSATFEWTPKRNAETVLYDTYQWLREHEKQLAPVFK